MAVNCGFSEWTRKEGYIHTIHSQVDVNDRTLELAITGNDPGMWRLWFRHSPTVPPRSLGIFICLPEAIDYAERKMSEIIKETRINDEIDKFLETV